MEALMKNVLTKIVEKRFNLNLSSTQILVIGFLALIFVGTILLNLPIASEDGKSIGVIDALFTATSAVCVTGLVVVNTLQQWTLFGKIVILVLIQVGGLGFMTFATALFIVMGRKINLKERLIIQEAFNQFTLAGMVRLSTTVLIGTLAVEGIGALLLSMRFIPLHGPLEGMGMAIFHSISAFCNAGFDIVGESSLTPFVGDIWINFIIMTLIVLGGLGFAVWIDLFRKSKEKIHKGYSMRKWFQSLTLHTKLVLVLTVFLILFGFIFFFIVEFTNRNTIGDMGTLHKVIASLFQSITTRTAGFNTLPLDQLRDTSKFMTIFLMIIGGSPAGTAGGVKTVTIGVLLLTVFSTVKGKEHTEAFNRRIPFDVVRRALAVVFISIGVVAGVTMILSITESASAMEVFFESASAFGTVGLSLGITSSLTTFGKIIVAFTMFIGRIGPVTMALAFTLKGSSGRGDVRKPEEKVMVG